MDISQCVEEIGNRRAMRAYPAYDASLDAVFAEGQLKDLALDLLGALKQFFYDYVTIPPKAVVLEAFESIVDSAMLALKYPQLVERTVKALLMAAASNLYDALVRGSAERCDI